jgi:allophanate hydrolase
MNFPELSIAVLKTSDSAVIEKIYERMNLRGEDAVWISKLPKEAVVEASTKTPGKPLSGVPFAIKDNIDLAGIPTTAACPDFTYTPDFSAFVVQRLIDAGAVPIGKTNLDQFATGLVGVRSPYGTPKNPYHADYIPGGSSSGSAVAVAAGLCSFSLGTDTAGSGRVPASFNNLIGVKPTKGLLSTRGVVPACRTLDCVSLFARSVGDAAEVLAVAAGYDEEDPYSRPAISVPAPAWPPRLGVPRAAQLDFFGDEAAKVLFAEAVARWKSLGATIVEIDFAPFLDAAKLLYEGPWVAERYAAIKAFIEKNPEALHPVTRKIIEGARKLGTVEAFEAMYKLEALKRESEKVWKQVDAILTPTAGTIYTVAEVEADPIRLNSNLGYYTNHMNLLDLCALAVPAGFLPNDLPWGITLSAPAFHDDNLLSLGARFLGEAEPVKALASPATVQVAVCGAHLSGLPLNGQLTSLGATLVKSCRTSEHYRFYALPGTTPPKPGLVRVKENGQAIDVEVWELPVQAYGSFVSAIPAPLGIGRIELEDGSLVQGFLCEAYAVEGARDISEYRGWRAYLKSVQQ